MPYNYNRMNTTQQYPLPVHEIKQIGGESKPQPPVCMDLISASSTTAESDASESQMEITAQPSVTKDQLKDYRKELNPLLYTHLRLDENLKMTSLLNKIYLMNCSQV